jgi:ubiquinone/menaquinone biosynthesis C-methylase UbiE
MSNAISTQPELQSRITELMKAYYENYYRRDLGLRDWEARVTNRLTEEQNLAEPHLAKIERWMDIDFTGKRVLVVGAGTGAETVALAKHGAEVYSIEPYDKAIEILLLKADLHGIPQDRFAQTGAENIPHADNFFDFVYCYTVIEHVKDLDQSIDEMLRVCKVGGLVYIQTLDFRFPYEPHYKIQRVPFSPRWVTAVQLFFSRRPIAFLRTVQMVTVPQLDRIFMKRNVVIMRVIPPWLRDWQSVRTQNKFFYWFVERFGIGRDQFIFLKKQGVE